MIYVLDSREEFEPTPPLQYTVFDTKFYLHDFETLCV